ncbi:MAG: hypothetical protein COV59_04375 [Candidatus Magasanikbacteria bacterium CG11_big_fil_rev_8_21_14_0_20_39_34]|uniref:LamG-like jellyroll fold domain-containing protein n=1 Tax=Candidatus Magasanikbacteria bacterium CG11_big_fil_rev_8_21_14_0_20_39_34 TaxID=1974653 RepID=A0A2H0N4Q3_9BACT|nr:MAG: hypothetical protein COV59_04375 [Candidatus Magasanikbacteria bacterium CG11_big_fil_rev_8_21_14_0_20_39_34]
MRKTFFDRCVSFLAILILVIYPVSVYASTFTDSSCTGEFGSGTNSDTECSSEQVQLDSTGLTNGSGNFTSRILSASSATWSTLAWSPYQPYLKELPDSKGADSGYTAGNIDMTDNILLYHMNDSSGDLVDSSSNGYTGTVTGATLGATGILNTGVSFDGNDKITVSDSDALSLNTTGNLSVAFWVKTGSNVTSLQKILEKGGIASDANFEWTVDIYNSKFRAAYSASNGNTIRSEQSNVTLSTNTWYHVVAVFTGYTSTNEVYIYVNGAEGSTVTGQAGYSYSNTATQLGIGTGYGGHVLNYFSGSLDELAIFSDALTATEALDIYKRGALTLKYQVRSCDDSACSGESFIGPDGTNSTYYSELTSAENGTPSKTLSNVSDNSYFQYKAFLSTLNSSYTPVLLDATITYSSTAGIPEFSDAVYVVILLFGMYYIARFSSRKDMVSS